MAVQRESLLVGNPFTNYLKFMGWNVKKTHGNQYQEGFPDSYLYHTRYSPRWVEFKVWDGGSIKLTDSQKRNFPTMMSCNVPIFVIVHTDLRNNESELQRLYKKLFEEPNVHFAFNKSSFHLLK
jgi:hypothetical protein